MTKDRLFEIRSSWILPSGEILTVPCERHEDYLPPICKTEKDAENSCVKVSCGWGYDAPISEIYLPRTLTIGQARVLKTINEELAKENKSIENKINIWHNPMEWNEILERA